MQAVQQKDLETAILRLDAISNSLRHNQSAKEEAKRIFQRYGPQLPESHIDKLVDSNVIEKNEIGLVNFLAKCKSDNIQELDAYISLTSKKEASGEISHHVYAVLGVRNTDIKFFCHYESPINPNEFTTLFTTLKNYIESGKSPTRPAGQAPSQLTKVVGCLFNKYRIYLNDFNITLAPRESRFESFN